MACPAELRRQPNRLAWSLPRFTEAGSHRGACGIDTKVTMAEAVLEPSIAARLLTAIRDLSFARDLPSITEVVRVAARDLTGADGVTFVLRVEGHCFYAAENAIGPLWQGRRFPLEQCISGWVMLHASPAIIEDIYQDPRIPHDAYRPTFVHSLAMVPVRREAPVAAIGMYWAAHHLATTEELGVAEMLADAVSLALSNVTLYEELQRAKSAAEQASRAKDEWLSVVSHELRTPLNVVAGWVDALRRGPELPIDRPRALETIARNATTAIGLVDEILDASKLTLGALQLTTAPVLLADAARDAVDRLRPAAESRHISLTVDIGADHVVLGDRTRLGQVFWHLIGNAIKFTDPGGRVGVAVRRNENDVQVVVTDTGRGMEPAVLGRLFGHFIQGDMSPTREKWGLGLAIARRLVELHGGTITAHSDGLGKGSTFVIQLPTGREPLPLANLPDLR
jgi:signal transduction histidine kinase